MSRKITISGFDAKGYLGDSTYDSLMLIKFELSVLKSGKSGNVRDIEHELDRAKSLPVTLPNKVISYLREDANNVAMGRQVVNPSIVTGLGFEAYAIFQTARSASNPIWSETTPLTRLYIIKRMMHSGDRTLEQFAAQLKALVIPSARIPAFDKMTIAELIKLNDSAALNMVDDKWVVKSVNPLGAATNKRRAIIKANKPAKPAKVPTRYTRAWYIYKLGASMSLYGVDKKSSVAELKEAYQRHNQPKDTQVSEVKAEQAE